MAVLLPLLLLPLLAAASPIFPSCLAPATTWDPALASSITPGVATPELCQQLCAADSACLGFTWLSALAPLYALSCATFPALGPVVPCAECVSGPPACPCSGVPGECETGQGNVVAVFSEVAEEADCSRLCSEEPPCSHYSFFGEHNPLRHICIIFSSCRHFNTSCTDCFSGVQSCSICSFDDTMDGSCLVDQIGLWDTAFSLAEEHALEQDRLLTTLPRLGREWRLTFSFLPTSYTDAAYYENLLHLTIGNGGNIGTYGDRTPGIWFHPSYGMLVISAVNGDDNYNQHFPYPAVGEWTVLQIVQEKQEDRYIYRILSGGQELFAAENSQPAEFLGVKVYASSPWSPAQHGAIRDLTIQTKQE